jgi:hypothetical protein
MLADGTYDKDGLKIAYPDGYQVGLWDNPRNINEEYFNTMGLSQLIYELSQVSDQFGAWTDYKTGQFWVEPCVWIKDLSTAKTVGRALNQIAIWDWANMKEIRLNQ